MTTQPLPENQFNAMLAKVEGKSFAESIADMNNMYKLPVRHQPTLDIGEDCAIRVARFMKTMRDEITEGDDILAALKTVTTDEEAELVLVALADWFSDITVYARSEATKFGIPLEATQSAVMASNATKLPDSGIPIYDDNGKFLKDKKNFIAPEPAIRSILFGFPEEA